MGKMMEWNKGSLLLAEAFKSPAIDGPSGSRFAPYPGHARGDKGGSTARVGGKQLLPHTCPATREGYQPAR